MSFESLWTDLSPIGRGAAGYARLPGTGAEAELRAWFAGAAAGRGLRLEEDGFGNQVAWWDADPAAPAGRAVLTGSHLDGVPDGGAYDGALGVAAALAAVDALRERVVSPRRPLGVVVLAEREGTRFGVECLGSRLAAGALPWHRARALTDARGVRLDELVPGGSTLLQDVAAFVEVHVEQGRVLAEHGAPVGAATGIWPHGRWRYEFVGRADHAGGASMSERCDPMLTYAMTALAANKQARLAGQRATFGRIAVAPNRADAVPERVTGWLDARAGTAEALEALVAAVTSQGTQRAGRDGTRLVVTAEHVAGPVVFDGSLAPGVRALPALPATADHDAGVLRRAGLPAAMLLVRNRTGVSHAPEEQVDPGDCAAAVRALTDVLDHLLG